MKRFWIILLAAAMALVIALPAGAVKPPKPTPSAPVAVSLEGDPMWVHEAGDVIWYSVTVQNKTRAAIEVNIEGYAGNPVQIDARGVVTIEDLFFHDVNDADIAAAVDILGTLTVVFDGGKVIAETSTLVDPVDECIFENEDGDQVVTKSGLCIWKPSPGTWELSAVPDPKPTRPTNLMMTMRDGVPGNWCTLTPGGTGGVVQERWLPKSSTSIELNVYLPGADGVCLTGGHGVCIEDDCYFTVGNPDSFYLYTTFDATITLTGS